MEKIKPNKIFMLIGIISLISIATIVPFYFYSKQNAQIPSEPPQVFPKGHFEGYNFSYYVSNGLGNPNAEPASYLNSNDGDKNVTIAIADTSDAIRTIFFEFPKEDLPVRNESLIPILHIRAKCWSLDHGFNSNILILGKIQWDNSQTVYQFKETCTIGILEIYAIDQWLDFNFTLNSREVYNDDYFWNQFILDCSQNFGYPDYENGYWGDNPGSPYPRGGTQLYLETVEILFL
jgi:hypothetical protein